MADPTRPARWRCPACGRALEPSDATRPDEIRLTCPGCGGQFRVRRRAGASASFSGEVPAVKATEPAAVGDLGLRWRGLALLGLEAGFRAGNLAGAAALLLLGGFVPVGRAWLGDRLSGWADVVTLLGGIPATAPAGDPDADYGPTLARGDAPDLFDEVAEVARRLGARPPEQVRLTYLPCCGVFASGRSRAVVLGLPLLHVLTRAELRAVLAHELAHLARGDATRAARSSRFVHALGRGLEAARHRRSFSPLRLWARSCRAGAERLHAPIARGQEVRADRASAAIAGGGAAASALVKVAAVQPIFREVLDAFDPDDPDSGSVFAFFRRFWDGLPEPLREAIRHRLLSEDAAAPDPAHPPLLDRIAAVQAYPSRPSAGFDAAPASSVVGDLEALELMLHNRLFALARVEPTVFHRAGR